MSQSPRNGRPLQLNFWGAGPLTPVIIIPTSIAATVGSNYSIRLFIIRKNNLIVTQKNPIYLLCCKTFDPSSEIVTRHCDWRHLVLKWFVPPTLFHPPRRQAAAGQEDCRYCSGGLGAWRSRVWFPHVGKLVVAWNIMKCVWENMN